MCRHTVRKIFSCHNARNRHFLRMKTLFRERRTQLASLSHKRKPRPRESLHAPLVHKSDQVLFNVIKETRWALVQLQFIPPTFHGSSKVISTSPPPGLLARTHLHGDRSLVLSHVFLFHQAIHRRQNLQLLACRIELAALKSTVHSFGKARRADPSRIVYFHFHFDL